MCLLYILAPTGLVKCEVDVELTMIELNVFLIVLEPQVFTERVILHILKRIQIQYEIVEIEKLSPR